MADRYLPPVEFLRECFSYNPETGETRWRCRPDSHFESPEVAERWNTRWAGARAFERGDVKGYRVAELSYCGRRLRLRLHRVAFKLLTGEEPEVVDHRNHDIGRNTADNLRSATVLDNRRNNRGNRNKCLPKGVFSEGRKFAARANDDTGRWRHLGTFDTVAAAHKAYCDFIRPLHGEFFNAGVKFDPNLLVGVFL